MGLKIFMLFFLMYDIVHVYKQFTRKYKNPYTLDIYFGKKGCGKSTTLQRLATKYHRMGWTVFSDEGETLLPFVKQVDCSKLHHYRYPPNSVILCSEANIHWDNRDFKKFDPQLGKWFRKQRHKRVKCIFFSQTYDVDKKLRDLADRLIICKKFAGILTVMRSYIKQPIVLPAGEMRETASIADDFVPIPIIFGGLSFTYIPKWIYCFDSFND